MTDKAPPVSERVQVDLHVHVHIDPRIAQRLVWLIDALFDGLAQGPVAPGAGEAPGGSGGHALQRDPGDETP